MNSAIDFAKIANPEAQAGSNMAFAVGFFFSARAITVLVAAQFFGMEARTGAALNLVLNFLLLVVVIFHSMGPGMQPVKPVLRLPAVRWVLIYLLLSCCSLAWSVTVSPASSLSYWSGLASDVAIVILLLCGNPSPGIPQSLMKGFIWSTCLLSLVAWLMPAQTDLRLGDPDYFNTNQIANLCAFAILFAQYLTRRNDGKWGIVILFLVVTMVRSLSKTTLAAFFLSEIFLVVRDQAISRKQKMALAAGTVVLALAFWGLFEAYYDVYTTAGNQAETLTGRTAIWAYCFDAGLEKPWLGNGFDSMWKVVPPFGSEQFEARHAENELLQQFYAYGSVGVALLFCLYGSLWWCIRKLNNRSERLILLTLLLYVLIRGLAEAEPFDLLLPLWVVTLVAVLVARGTSRAEEPVAITSTAAEFGFSQGPERSLDPQSPGICY